MQATHDLAVVGSGFAGSLIATIARRLGHSVILIERGKHPRFAIGESSTPLANLLLEELARRYDLPQLLPLTKWGTWQLAHPDIACGLKRGFTFFHHDFDRTFQNDRQHQRQLLVAASPHDGIADTHWYRPDFDHFLAREAAHLGVELREECRLERAISIGNQFQLEGTCDGKPLHIRARFVIDASGPRGFLHRALGLTELPLLGLPRTQALFSHFTGVGRWEDLHPTGKTAPPYPVDDAAMHHVFEGGWIWVLRFNNGLTSAGVAATDRLANNLNLAEGQSAWERLLARLPSVREQFAEAQPQLSFAHLPQLSFRSAEVAGPNWALLPSAAGFVDPLLSTGFPLTLLGVTRLAEAIEQEWETPRFAARLDDYVKRTARELLAAELLVAALYASMNDFAIFAPLTLLYFAAASFSETARRLQRPQLASSFLLHDHPTFGHELQSCCRYVLTGPAGAAWSDSERAGL
ncbi:MAG: FAD-dependent oxidoreductase, partial [Verrucomicrobia bacterium]|nr:FAD-dependent oxidoreductase [Verrucomicrobiota bacterium]